MTLLRPGIRKLLRIGAFRRTDAMRDVDDEVRLHLELRLEELMRAGLDAATAEAEARRLFANDDETVRALYTTANERNRQMRIREQWESLAQDTRYAARGLRRDPWLATFVVLILALGIGANVTTFSLVDRLLLRGPEHVTEPARLARLYRRIDGLPAGRQTAPWIPYQTYGHLRDGMTAFELLGAYRPREVMVGRGEDARKRRIEQTMGAFFSVLGAHPLRGRFFAADEDADVNGALAVISEQLWRSEFGGADSAIGRPILIGDEPHTIVGVAPRGFTGPEVKRVDAWTLAGSRAARTVNWSLVGRMRPGVTLESVAADAALVHRRTAADGPPWMRAAVMIAAPIGYGDSASEPVETTMARWLASVAAIILLITFANVVNLLLVRLARRRRELAIRVALGSGRGRVMRLLALEGALLAVAGGLASFTVAAITEPIVRRALFADDAGWAFSIVDSRVLAIVLAIVLITALLVGVIPAMQAGSPSMTGALRSGVQAGGGNSRVRSSLTVVQAALSVVLLIGAGLFVRSLSRVGEVDLGVDADRVVMATVNLPLPSVLNAASIDERAMSEEKLYRRFAESTRRLPGVEHTAVTVGVPLDGGDFTSKVSAPGMDSIPALPGGGPYVSAVSADYFATVGTRLVRGRGFTDADGANSEPVVIVSETMARALWRGRDALASCVQTGTTRAPRDCARVVGVAADVHRIGLHEEPSLQFYVPLGQQHGFSGATLLVRPDARRPVEWSAVRKAILDTDPSIHAADLKLLGASLDESIRPLRIGMVTFGLSGVLALIVAMLGLYSLMAYLVAWRTREIGVRVALGASDTQITWLVVTNGARLAGLGVLAGLTAALVGGRWLEPHLFATSAHDPMVLAGAAVALLAVSFVAGWVPARRAMRISPMEALRAE